MKKTIAKFLVSNLFIALGALYAQAAATPVLFFSDIISGPNSGNGDGKGSGAIVTIWGANLGSSQGTSTVQIGGVKTDHVYCWGNADGSTCGGPAKLYNGYQNYQAISFSIPSGVNGSANISVTVGGTTSNTLSFTVQSGRILFVAPGGTDVVNGGSYASPWKTLNYVTGRTNNPTLLPGDIVYVMNGVSAGEWDVYPTVKGSAGNNISFLVYPGASSVIASNTGTGIGMYKVSPYVQYVNFSKFTVQTTGMGIQINSMSRMVANEVTNYPGPGGCATGQEGAFSGDNENIGVLDIVGGTKLLGNYIHDLGCVSTSNLYHDIYMSNRGGLAIPAYEVGWNYLANNYGNGGLHFYDEHQCGDFIGNTLVHDNAIINQYNGDGIDVGATGTVNCITSPFYFYNNLLVNTGQDVSSFGTPTAISVYNLNGVAGAMASKVYIWNNTIYGYGQSANDGSMYWGKDLTSGPVAFTVDFRNNIVVDTLGAPFDSTDNTDVGLPSSATNNIFYSPSGQPKPTWASDPSNLISNPQLVNPIVGGNYALLQGSPAINTGATMSPIVTMDILGASRTVPFSIGAFQFQSTLVSAPPASPRGFILK